MSDEKITVGDKVRLNSGGPTMTVSKVCESGNLECMWFGDTKDVSVGHFPLECLTIVPGD